MAKRILTIEETKEGKFIVIDTPAEGYCQMDALTSAQPKDNKGTVSRPFPSWVGVEWYIETTYSPREVAKIIKPYYIKEYFSEDIMNKFNVE